MKWKTSLAQQPSVRNPTKNNAKKLIGFLRVTHARAIAIALYNMKIALDPGYSLTAHKLKSDITNINNDCATFLEVDVLEIELFIHAPGFDFKMPTT
jgi:hypothetical protein